MQIWRHYFFALFILPHIALAEDLPSAPTCTLISSSGTMQKWTWVCNGETVTGNAKCSDTGGTIGTKSDNITTTSKHDQTDIVHCWCKINTQSQTYWTYAASLPANICNMGRTGCLGYCDATSGDAPWDSADNYQQYISGLFSSTPPETPCDIGISTIRTNTGVSVQLYKHQLTTPSVVVRYRDKTCYGKLAPGTAQNQIHINYNNQIYHTTD